MKNLWDQGRGSAGSGANGGGQTSGAKQCCFISPFPAIFTHPRNFAKVWRREKRKAWMVACSAGGFSSFECLAAILDEL